MSSEPTVTGSCLCGAIRFSVRLPSLWCAHCHCSMCRRNHGAGYVTWFGVPRSSLEIESEADLARFRSSEHGARSFCARCGSSLFCELTHRPDEVDIVLANVHASIDREPQMHIHFDDRVGWVAVDDGLPRLGGASGLEPVKDDGCSADARLKRELSHRDFEDLSWHDCEIRGFELRVGDPERDDWTSDLVLDIDYIAEWVSRDDGMRFRIAPATLVFHGATELRVEIDSARAGPQVSLCLPSIAAIERERVREQRVFLDRPYYRWLIRLNGIPDGEIAFGAVGFTQTLRADPVLCEQPRLPRTLRRNA